jgi:hypothetical protein
MGALSRHVHCKAFEIGVPKSSRRRPYDCQRPLVRSGLLLEKSEGEVIPLIHHRFRVSYFIQT